MSTSVTSQIVQTMQHLTLGKVQLRQQLTLLEEQRLSFVEQGHGDYYNFLKESLENELGMCSTLLSYYFVVI